MDVEIDSKKRNTKEEPEYLIEPSTSDQVVQRTEEIIRHFGPEEDSAPLEPIAIPEKIKIEVKEEEESLKVRRLENDFYLQLIHEITVCRSKKLCLTKMTIEYRNST